MRRVRLFAIGIPVFVGLIAGASAQGDWQQIQLFLNAEPFGVTDPQFGHDIGFYAFELPFYEWLLSWLFIAVAVSFIGAVIAHYLFGGIRLAGRGGQLSGPARLHLAIVAGMFVLLKAVAYFFDRYTLLFSTRNEQFNGASYTDLNAVLPAKLILLCIAVFCAVAFFVGRVPAQPAAARHRDRAADPVQRARRRGVAGGAGAVLGQAERHREGSRVDHAEHRGDTAGVRADRRQGRDEALRGQAETSARPRSRPTTRRRSATSGCSTRASCRAPSPSSSSCENFYGFPNKLDVDRYTVDGKLQDYIVAVRELNLDSLPQDQRDWINQHLIYTHGNGFVARRANKVNARRRRRRQRRLPGLHR